MTLIDLNLLHDDPKSSNVCSTEVLEKLRRNIEKTKLYPPLIVRPKDKHSQEFVIIDGHHRKRILESLGYTEAECLIWDISEVDARIALATLNTLRGTDDLSKRAELVRDLTQIISADELSLFLPESSEEIADLLAILEHDVEQLEQSLREQTAAEKDALPVPFTFLIAAGDVPGVEEALTRFQPPKTDRGVALVQLCAFALKQVEPPHGQSETA